MTEILANEFFANYTRSLAIILEITNNFSIQLEKMTDEQKKAVIYLSAMLSTLESTFGAAGLGNMADLHRKAHLGLHYFKYEDFLKKIRREVFSFLEKFELPFDTAFKARKSDVGIQVKKEQGNLERAAKLRERGII